MQFNVAKDLSPIRQRAKATINASAGAFRLNFITDVPGQALIYQNKYEQALAYLADPDISDDLIPGIVAEVGTSSGTSKYEVAQVIVNKAYLWQIISAKIERIRTLAIQQVETATSEKQILEAQEIDWTEVVK